MHIQNLNKTWKYSTSLKKFIKFFKKNVLHELCPPHTVINNWLHNVRKKYYNEHILIIAEGKKTFIWTNLTFTTN